MPSRYSTRRRIKLRGSCRLGLSLLLALASLALLLSSIRSLAARSSPPDPLAFAAKVGLNQAWYVRHGYADGSAEAPSIAPARFPSPTPSTQAVLTDTLDHHIFLPLVRGDTMTEARALWVTRWDYTTVTDVRTLVENAAGAGFNMLLFQVRGTADAFYEPGLEPWGARLSGKLGQYPGWDPLQTAIEAAHAHDLELHAYVNVYPVWVRSAEPAPPLTTTDPVHLFWTLTRRYGDDWRVTRRNEEGITATMPLTGSHYLWATPALTDVVDRVVSVTADLGKRYDVDGVHLDMVRYPGPDYSYDPFTEAALAGSGLSRDEWQRRQVTLLVDRVYSEVTLPRRDLRLSAAVWPVYEDRWEWGYSEGYESYYQDSQGWMADGIIDAIMPMIYPVDVCSSPDVFTSSQFSTLVSDFLRHSSGRHVFPGISAQYPDFDQIAQRIAIARELGAPGHAVFSARLVDGNYPCGDLDRSHDPYWDEFAAGPYAEPATVPRVTWHP